MLTKPVPAGKTELIEALKKSDLESVMFNVDLGPNSISNREILANNFSIDLDKKTRAHSSKNHLDLSEPIRIVEDALSCVENLEFLGQRSAPFSSNQDLSDARNGTFCSMPVKVSFSDRDSRINFEKTLSEFSGIRASQSYPKQVRAEMAMFRKALVERYPDKLIMTRPAPLPALELISFGKIDGDRRWTKLNETHPLAMNILLPTYTAPNRVVLSQDPEEDLFADCVGGENPPGGNVTGQKSP